MEKLPEWAPRGRKHKVRRLYETNAQALIDDESMDEVVGRRGRRDQGKTGVGGQRRMLNVDARGPRS